MTKKYFCYERYHKGWMGVFHTERPKKEAGADTRIVERSVIWEVDQNVTLEEAVKLHPKPAHPDDFDIHELA
jgi:hypothetical protein